MAGFLATPFRHALVLFLATALCGLLVNPVRAATLVENQDFTGASGTTHGSWAIQGGGAAFITTTQADGTTGTVVQLTPAAIGQSGTLIFDQAFSSSLGVQVVFDYYMAGGTGADGIAFFLVDGTETNVTPGKSGGGLGYGTDYSITPGVPNAYFGVGFDKYGSGATEFGNAAGTGWNNGPRTPNNFILVGSGNGTTGYRYLVGATNASLGGGWRKADILLRRGNGANGCADGGICVTVRFSTDNGVTWTTMHNNVQIDTLNGQVAIPATFKLGFSGSTGGSTNNHYIDNVQIFLDGLGYQVSVSRTGSGSGTVTSTSVPSQATQFNCGAVCDVAYPVNTLVTLIAAADIGSTFTGWGGDCSGTASSATVTVDAAKSCTASFVPMYTVSTSAGANGSISPAAATVIQGDTVSFTVTGDKGYGVASISGCGGTLSGNTYTTSAVTSDCTVTASFSAMGDAVVESGGGGGAIDWLVPLALVLLWLCRNPFEARRMMAAILLAGASGPGLAGDSRLYAGAQFGWAFTDADEGDVTTDLLGRGISADVKISDTNRAAWRLFGGYRFNRHLAVEGGYTNLGRITTRLQGVGSVSVDEVDDVLPHGGRGAEVAAVGRYAFSARYQGLARIGLWRWRSEYELRDVDGLHYKSTDRGTDVLAGLGLEMQLTRHWSARLGGDHYHLGGDPSNFYYLAVVFSR